MLPKITAIIPCKNEQHNLGACIASARLVADEILVADSGSTDGSVAIARQLADRVVEREYIDSGDFKNWAIPQARHRWVLIIDADERVSVALAEEIQQRLATDDKYDAYSIPRLNYLFGYPIHHGDWSKDRVTRLFRRDQCRYKLHTDHAEIDVPRAKLSQLKQRMVHYTAWDPHTYLEKMAHYAKQQASVWHAAGRRPAIIHITLNPPMRFLRGYVLRGGFRDGMIGFLVATMTAYYSFLKQFYLWQQWNGRRLHDVEPTFTTTDLTDDQTGIAEAA